MFSCAVLRTAQLLNAAQPQCTSSRRSERASRTEVRVGALFSSICRTLQLLATLPVRLCFLTCDAYDNCVSRLGSTQPWLSSLRLRTQGTRRLPFKPMPGTSGSLASLTGRRLSSGWRQAELQYAAKPRGSYFRASCFVGCAAVLLRLEAGVKPWHAVRSFLKRVSRHGPTRVHHGAGFALWLRPKLLCGSV